MTEFANMCNRQYLSFCNLEIDFLSLYLFPTISLAKQNGVYTTTLFEISYRQDIVTLVYIFTLVYIHLRYGTTDL
jgi:hypothetical protein